MDDFFPLTLIQCINVEIWIREVMEKSASDLLLGHFLLELFRLQDSSIVVLSDEYILKRF